MTLSLRAKLALALIGTAVATIVVAGASVRWLESGSFDAFVAERAFTGFGIEAVAYYEEYGSWEAAREAESFFAFTERLRFESGGPPGRNAGTPPPGRPGDRRAGAGPGGRPGPGGPGARSARDSGPSGPRGPGGTPPLRPPQGGGPVAVNMDPVWVIANVAGVVEIQMGGYEVGDALPSRNLRLAMPLVSEGETVGLAVPVERPALTAIEERYFASMERAWLLALLFAAVVSVPAAILLAHRLARPLRDLDSAMAAMHSGQLRQKVGVRSRDEIGRLADRFNSMSERLARSYEELESSRSELDRRAKELDELSRSDALTGIFNRRAFDDWATFLVNQARRYGHPVSFAMLDLDHFKTINDTYSHATGDRVLVRTAELLVEALRDTDLVARYGGEEFVVAFPETEADSALALGERIRRAFLDEPWQVLAEGLEVTVSIGVVQIEGDEGVAEVLERADARLYAAKKAGRNRVLAS